MGSSVRGCDTQTPYHLEKVDVLLVIVVFLAAKRRTRGKRSSRDVRNVWQPCLREKKKRQANEREMRNSFVVALRCQSAGIYPSRLSRSHSLSPLCLESVSLVISMSCSPSRLFASLDNSRPAAVSLVLVVPVSFGLGCRLRLDHLYLFAVFFALAFPTCSILAWLP